MPKSIVVQYQMVRPKMVLWLELFEPKPVQMKGADPNKKNYRLELVMDLDDPDLQAMEGIAQDVLKQVAADNKMKITHAGLGGHHWPFILGEKYNEQRKDSMERNDKEWKDVYAEPAAGKMVLKTSSPERIPPQLLVRGYKKYQLVDDEYRGTVQSQFYRGMLAIALVSFRGYHVSAQSWGVSCHVNAVAATGLGSPIGRRPIDVDAFGVPPSLDDDPDSPEDVQAKDLRYRLEKPRHGKVIEEDDEDPPY
jgi:hypothetical protein